MEFVETQFGFSTADAEDVEVRFSKGDLLLSFRDWQEQPQAITFRDCLAFHWEEPDDGELQNDVCYEVRDSPWLARQAELQAVGADGYMHYKLCFNQCGMLDVIARRHSE
jgi:hypothetical protein